MSAREMFEKLGYACDESCDGILYSKWIKENNTDYEIQINFEKRPDDITLEELQAINKQVEELGWNNEK